MQLLKAKGGPQVVAKVKEGFPHFTVSRLAPTTMAKLKEVAQDNSLSILAASSTAAERRLAESLAAPLLRFNFEVCCLSVACVLPVCCLCAVGCLACTLPIQGRLEGGLCAACVTQLVNHTTV